MTATRNPYALTIENPVLVGRGPAMTEVLPWSPVMAEAAYASLPGIAATFAGGGDERIAAEVAKMTPEEATEAGRGMVAVECGLWSAMGGEAPPFPPAIRSAMDRIYRACGQIYAAAFLEVDLVAAERVVDPDYTMPMLTATAIMAAVMRLPETVTSATGRKWIIAAESAERGIETPWLRPFADRGQGRKAA